MKRMSHLRLAWLSFAVILLNPLSAQSVEPSNRILDQPGAPVKILSYRALPNLIGDTDGAGIIHRVQYENISGRDIIAVEIGLVSFDVWDQFLNGIWETLIREIKRGDRHEDVWEERHDAAFTFFTGTAYVSRVRFDDGRMWSADLNKILKILQQIDPELSLQTLKNRGRY